MRMGVVPAWLDWPVMVTSCQEMPLQVFDRADGKAFDVEHRALLDVQLDEGVRIDGAGNGVAAIADARKLIAQHRAVDGLHRQRIVQPHAAGIDERAQHVGREARTLLIGEHRDGERAARRDAGIVEALNDLEAGEHAVIAVVAAAGAHRVDMRAGHDRRHILLALAQGDDVADLVDPHVEAEFAHPGHDEVAALLVVVGQRQAAAAAALDGADLRQPVQPVHQARVVDVQIARTHAAATSAALRPTIWA
jgi:hypothetical protein